MKILLMKPFLPMPAIVSHRMHIVFSLLFALLFLPSAVVSGAFLDAEDAFRVSADLDKSDVVRVHWDIAGGYKLYRNQIGVSLKDGSANLGTVVLPAGIVTRDSLSGEHVEIYHDGLDLEVPFSNASAPFTLAVVYQGCSEDGLCYPPLTSLFRVVPDHLGPIASLGSSGGFSDLSPPSPTSKSIARPLSASDQDMAASMLMEGNLWKIAFAFLVFGLLLSLTPCILPMVPILSSIIAGEGSVSKLRNFLLALAYSMGMALVYMILGIVAGLAGEGLSGFLQKPLVIVMFAVLLVLLSLSMFDVYQLQVPSSLQQRLSSISSKGGGRFAGVFLMGAVSALLIGPCVAAPLAGTLVYISQTRDVVIGGLALFSMALGMSVPLLLIGVSAGFLLPKAGGWMVGVKYVFGLLLIAVAVWMLGPVLPPQGMLLAWGVLAILSAIFLGFAEPIGEMPSAARRFRKALAYIAFIVGVLEVVGAASGAISPFRPLSEFGIAEKMTVSADAPRFTRVTSLDEFDALLRVAEGPVMLDFYADWCVSCKELEHVTFQDPAVARALRRFTLLQVDVTANSENDRAFMRRFGLFGPPAVIFFNPDGVEQFSSRVVGFLAPDAFLERINAVP